MVRERVGDLLGAISEAVVGAQAIRAYGVEDRTAERIDAADRGAPQGARIGAQALLGRLVLLGGSSSRG